MLRSIAALLLVGTSALLADAPPPVPPSSNPAALRWYTQLKMHYLPKESGFLSIIDKSEQTLEVHGKRIPVQGQVYYMLTRELSSNYLHWLESDDTQILIEGGPVDYYVFHPDGRAEKITLGREVEKGQVLVIPVHGGCWKALRLHPGADYVLLANCLSPDWTQDRVRIGEGQAWVERFKGAAPWATEAFLRELIGPNAKP